MHCGQVPQAFQFQSKSLHGFYLGLCVVNVFDEWYAQGKRYAGTRYCQQVVDNKLIVCTRVFLCCTGSMIFKSARNKSVWGMICRRTLSGAYRHVSTAVWIPFCRHACSRAIKNSGCISGSPPVKVTPPPERSKILFPQYQIQHFLNAHFFSTQLQSPGRAGSRVCVIITRTTVEAARGVEHHHGVRILPFRIVAPLACQRTAFEEYVQTDTRSVVDGVSLYVKDTAFYGYRIRILHSRCGR